MEAKAITRHIRQSPRKIRILLDDLRGVKVDKAMNYLHFSKAKAELAEVAARLQTLRKMRKK